MSFHNKTVRNRHYKENVEEFTSWHHFYTRKSKDKKTHIHLLPSKPAPGTLPFLSKSYNHKMTNKFLFKFEIISYDLNLLRNQFDTNSLWNKWNVQIPSTWILDQFHAFGSKLIIPVCSSFIKFKSVPVWWSREASLSYHFTSDSDNWWP